MFKLFSQFRKKRSIWNFDGGILPPEKKIQSNRIPLRQISLASRFIVPLKQHIGTEGELCIKPGDHVLRGQSLSIGYNYMLPVHAPTSGKIIAIVPHNIAHSSPLMKLSIIIDPDGKDCWIERDGWKNYYTHSRESLINRIQQFGVAGLGGAGFPTGVKLHDARRIHTLIINAAECEPYITADDRLMQDCAKQVIEGVRILAHILQPDTVLIGIEDNKQQAISMLRSALNGDKDIILRIIPTKYPSGSAKQLIQILTGKQIPHGYHANDIGILMQNVSTVFAVKRAIINGETLTERVVTLTGEGIPHPGNIWTRIGTPVHHLLEQVGFSFNKDQMVIMGGPLMGFALSDFNVPVVKTTNCLLIPSTREISKAQKERDCIRCGACASVCPMNLLPQQLYWYSKGSLHDKTIAHNLADCIECGACAWVCPSNIPLVKYFRQEKDEVYAISMKKKRTLEAKARFEARKARLMQEKTSHLDSRNNQISVQFIDKKNSNTSSINIEQISKEHNMVKSESIVSNQEFDALKKIEANLASKALPKWTASVSARKAMVAAAVARVKSRKDFSEKQKIHSK